MMDYTIEYEQSESGWSAYVPNLPGCVAAGESRGEVERLIKEAIEFHLEGLNVYGNNPMVQLHRFFWAAGHFNYGGVGSVEQNLAALSAAAPEHYVATT